MAQRHTDDGRDRGTVTTRRSLLQLGGLSVGALLGGGVAASVAQTGPQEDSVCEVVESGSESVGFGMDGYGAHGYGGVA